MPHPRRRMLHQDRPVERQLAGLREVDPGDREDGDQHREAAEDRVDQEFERGVDPTSLAPHPDQEVERNQHRLPEDIEEDEVQRQEDAGGGGLQEEQQQDELFESTGGRVGEDDGDQEEQGIQAEQEEAQAVDAEVIADSQRGNPLQRFLELQVEIAHALLESTDDRDHQGQREHRGEDPELFDDAPSDRRRERDEEGANQGEHEDQRQPRHVGGQGVPAHAPNFQGRYPRYQATMTRTPTAPPSVTRA